MSIAKESRRDNKRDHKEKKIDVRVDENLKEQFYAKCRQQAVDPSAWVRLQIERFLRND